MASPRCRVQQEEQQTDDEEHRRRDCDEPQDDEAHDARVGGVKPHGGEPWSEGPCHTLHVPPNGSWRAFIRPSKRSVGLADGKAHVILSSC